MPALITFYVLPRNGLIFSYASARRYDQTNGCVTNIVTTKECFMTALMCVNKCQIVSI